MGLHQANSSSFKKGHKGSKVSRRRLSENLVYSNLLAYGPDMFEILVNAAKNASSASDRIKAADKFLHYTLLLPKPNDDAPEENKVNLFILDFVKELQGQLAPESIDIMLSAIKNLQEKARLEKEQEEQGEGSEDAGPITDED
jgi:hypothetical protein